MKEHTRKKVDVLGIEVSVMRPEKAVNIAMNYINRKEITRMYFHTAASSLFAQSHEWVADWINSCNLVFAGDRSMEQHILSRSALQNETGAGNGSFADEFIKRLLYRLNREGKEIFIVMPSQEHLDHMKEYFRKSYPDIFLNGAILSETTEAECEKVVNEINGVIPDIVFVCVPCDQQIHLMNGYQSMINSHLLIGIESLVPLIQTEIFDVPRWIEIFHLTRLYYWFKTEGKFQKRIINSIFQRSIQQEVIEKQESKDETSEDMEKNPKFNTNDDEGEE